MEKSLNWIFYYFFCHQKQFLIKGLMETYFKVSKGVEKWTEFVAAPSYFYCGKMQLYTKSKGTTVVQYWCEEVFTQSGILSSLQS